MKKKTKKMQMLNTNCLEWTLLNNTVTSIDEILSIVANNPNSFKYIHTTEDNNLCGFVYLVEFSNGSKYIGKKNFFSSTKVNKGKKELASMPDKRGSKKKVVIKESNWRSYYGSIKDVEFNNSLKNNEIYIVNKTIIDLASTKAQLTYLEVKYQFLHSVLESKIYLNDNILGKFYSKILLPNTNDNT